MKEQIRELLAHHPNGLRLRSIAMYLGVNRFKLINLLDEMKKVEALSKIQSNPYKYVQAWFLKQFPECKPVHLDKNSEEKNATEKDSA